MIGIVRYGLAPKSNFVGASEYFIQINWEPVIVNKWTEKNSPKIAWHSTFLDMMDVLSKRSHCVSKKVAAFITRDSRIISTGINGTPPGFKNCDSIFKEEFDKDDHHNFSLAYEIHAEVNALLTAAKNGISTGGAALYVNYVPCRDCSKAILASGIKEVYFKEFYPRDMRGFTLLLCNENFGLYQMVEGENEDSINSRINYNINYLREELKEYLEEIGPLIN